MEETAQLQNPLDLVGGFEAYQNTVYQALMEKVKKMTVEEVLDYDRIIADYPEKKDGLKDGLLGLIQSQKYLTADNLKFLEPQLGFSSLGLFTEKLEPYLKAKNPKGIPVPSLVIEGGGLHRRTSEYLDLMFKIHEESDRIIAERRAA